MSSILPSSSVSPEELPDLTGLITEDNEPLDCIFTEKQQRLLTEPLYASWSPPGPDMRFLALANVGFFHKVAESPYVPDALLSLGVEPAGDLQTKEGHSYYLWLMKKPPDVIVEVVSDKRGGEDSLKLRAYARLKVPFYVIFDPQEELEGGVLRAYRLHEDGTDERLSPAWFPEVGLGVTLWEGPFEKQHQTWLRWCNQQGQVVPTGAEARDTERKRATEARKRADEERKRATEARKRADEAQARAERLIAQLKDLGIDPEA